jgi:AbrB family looped-hinge helix DNA binding protein
MITIQIGRRGQITIPRKIRRQLELNEGDRIALILQGDQVILRPIAQNLLDLRGSVPVTEPQDFTAIRRQVISTLGQKDAPGES